MGPGVVAVVISRMLSRALSFARLVAESARCWCGLVYGCSEVNTVVNTVRNFPGACDPREPCFGVPFSGSGRPFPYKWACRIVDPYPAPDGLPEFFYLESSFLTDPLGFLDFERTFFTGGVQTIFRFQVFTDDPPPRSGDPIRGYRTRFQYTCVERAWLSVVDLYDRLIVRPDLYVDTWTILPPAVPDPPPGSWPSLVDMRPLKWDGDDADAAEVF